MSRKRTELHLHTTMSAVDGVCTIQEYIDEAIAQGMSAISLMPTASHEIPYEGAKEMYGPIKILG